VLLIRKTRKVYRINFISYLVS